METKTHIHSHTHKNTRAHVLVSVWCVLDICVLVSRHTTHTESHVIDVLFSLLLEMLLEFQIAVCDEWWLSVFFFHFFLFLSNWSETKPFLIRKYTYTIHFTQNTQLNWNFFLSFGTRFHSSKFSIPKAWLCSLCLLKRALVKLSLCLNMFETIILHMVVFVCSLLSDDCFFVFYFSYINVFIVIVLVLCVKYEINLWISAMSQVEQNHTIHELKCWWLILKVEHKNILYWWILLVAKICFQKPLKNSKVENESLSRKKKLEKLNGKLNEIIYIIYFTTANRCFLFWRVMRIWNYEMKVLNLALFWWKKKKTKNATLKQPS